MLGELFKQRVTLFVVKGVIFSIKCQAGENIAKGSADPDIASLTESTYYMTRKEGQLRESVHIMPISLTHASPLFVALSPATQTPTPTVNTTINTNITSCGTDGP